MFENHKLDPMCTVSKAWAFTVEFMEANGWNKPADVMTGVDTTEYTVWRPPEVGFIKGNVDSAFNANSKQAGVGIVFRDDKGDPCEYSSSTVQSISALITEAMALKKAMQMASALELQKVCFESDCEVLINMVEEKVPNAD